MTKLVYAAYNAAPADLARTPEVEERWYEALREQPEIGGLELSFAGTLHTEGVERLAHLLDPGWRCVVTDIPGSIQNSAIDRRYGLASRTGSSRSAALAQVRVMHEQIRALHDIVGHGIVRAVELHSAPLSADSASSEEAFVDSLTEIASWDWGDVALVVEHADALVSEHPPEKGWLDLATETRAVASATARSGRRLGQSLNWGRSAIETRTANGPLEHLSQLKAAGTLQGFMFSGASGSPTSVSRPWQDAHLAIGDIEPASLLTTTAAVSALEALDSVPLLFLGVKVGATAADGTWQERLRPGLETALRIARLADEHRSQEGVSGR